MNNIDIIGIIILSLIVGQGAYNGILRTLLGPFYCLFSFAIGYVTLQLTDSVLTALATSGILTIALLLIINNVLYKITKGLPPRISFLSRIAGALINLAWMGPIVAVIFLLFTTVRYQDPQLEEIRILMKESSTCGLLEMHLLGMAAPSAPDSSCPSKECDLTPAAAKELKEDADIKELLDNESLQKAANDPMIRQALENKNILQFLSSPALAGVSKDKHLLNQIIKTYPKIRSRMTPPQESENSKKH